MFFILIFSSLIYWKRQKIKHYGVRGLQRQWECVNRSILLEMSLKQKQNVFFFFRGSEGWCSSNIPIIDTSNPTHKGNPSNLLSTTGWFTVVEWGQVSSNQKKKKLKPPTVESDIQEHWGWRTWQRSVEEVANLSNPKFHLTDLDLKSTFYLGAEKQMTENKFLAFRLSHCSQCRGRGKERTSQITEMKMYPIKEQWS